ncbi:hypothetical protein IE81DRAFT_228167 [Ceraceosorus guamensis]|uniref:Uncharacterized protein n=1 Tax=Ceraceosorus guamensis TaxID=1522189 RepID=A0A316WAS5_9BASI|nr:hypothetical protein IE81DRAFT_228167 [Ceraceosorus guamensis]PWN45073.1 hypothetical protein IE81DRAFT_228167 [Ceraceosorus guamensis]
MSSGTGRAAYHGAHAYGRSLAARFWPLAIKGLLFPSLSLSFWGVDDRGFLEESPHHLALISYTLDPETIMGKFARAALSSGWIANREAGVGWMWKEDREGLCRTRACCKIFFRRRRRCCCRAPRVRVLRARLMPPGATARASTPRRGARRAAMELTTTVNLNSLSALTVIISVQAIRPPPA